MKWLNTILSIIQADKLEESEQAKIKEVLLDAFENALNEEKAKGNPNMEVYVATLNEMTL